MERVITGRILEQAAEKLSQNAAAMYDARGLNATVTFEDDGGAAYIIFCQGKIFGTGDGYNEYGSEFYFAASNQDWMDTFNGDQRQNIYDWVGGKVRLKGNIYTFAGNIKIMVALCNEVKRLCLEQAK